MPSKTIGQGCDPRGHLQRCIAAVAAYLKIRNLKVVLSNEEGLESKEKQNCAREAFNFCAFGSEERVSANSHHSDPTAIIGSDGDVQVNLSIYGAVLRFPPGKCGLPGT